MIQKTLERKDKEASPKSIPKLAPEQDLSTKLKTAAEAGRGSENITNIQKEIELSESEIEENPEIAHVDLIEDSEDDISLQSCSTVRELAGIDMRSDVNIKDVEVEDGGIESVDRIYGEIQEGEVQSVERKHKEVQEGEVQAQDKSKVTLSTTIFQNKRQNWKSNWIQKTI